MFYLIKINLKMHRIEKIRNSRKANFDIATKGRYLVFKIEGNHQKLLLTSFLCHSVCCLFYESGWWGWGGGGEIGRPLLPAKNNWHFLAIFQTRVPYSTWLRMLVTDVGAALLLGGSLPSQHLPLLHGRLSGERQVSHDVMSSATIWLGVMHGVSNKIVICQACLFKVTYTSLKKWRNYLGRKSTSADLPNPRILNRGLVSRGESLAWERTLCVREAFSLLADFLRVGAEL